MCIHYRNLLPFYEVNRMKISKLIKVTGDKRFRFI